MRGLYCTQMMNKLQNSTLKAKREQTAKCNIVSDSNDVSKAGTAELSVLSMQPELSLEESALDLARKKLGIKVPARSPWSHHSALFEVLLLV